MSGCRQVHADTGRGCVRRRFHLGMHRSFPRGGPYGPVEATWIRGLRGWLFELRAEFRR